MKKREGLLVRSGHRSRGEAAALRADKRRPRRRTRGLFSAAGLLGSSGLRRDRLSVSSTERAHLFVAHGREGDRGACRRFASAVAPFARSRAVTRTSAIRRGGFDLEVGARRGVIGKPPPEAAYPPRLSAGRAARRLETSRAPFRAASLFAGLHPDERDATWLSTIVGTRLEVVDHRARCAWGR